MSETITGFIAKVVERGGKSRKTGKPYTAYSVKVEDTNGNELDPWFQCGFKDPGLKEGDYVRFKADKKDEGAYTVDVDTIKHGKNPPARKAKDTGKSGGSGGGKKGGGSSYNSDASRADRAYHASRGTAVEVIDMLLTHNALPVSASQGKAGKAKRYEEIMDFVNKLTVQFFRDEFPEGYDDTFRLLASVADAGVEDLSGDGDLPDADGDDNEFDDDFDDTPATDDGDDDDFE